MIPGIKLFYSSLALGWGIPAVGLTVALSLTGVSSRFGIVCHINHSNGLEDLWIPLLAFAAASMILQFATLLHCIQVYLKSLMIRPLLIRVLHYIRTLAVFGKMLIDHCDEVNAMDQKD